MKADAARAITVAAAVTIRVAKSVRGGKFHPALKVMYTNCNDTHVKSRPMLVSLTPSVYAECDYLQSNILQS